MHLQNVIRLLVLIDVKAALSVALIFYTLKTQEKRDKKQEERKKVSRNYS